VLVVANTVSHYTKCSKKQQQPERAARCTSGEKKKQEDENLRMV